MKRVVMLLMAVGLFGCSYGRQHVEYVLDNPGVLEDPLYVNYETKMADLESRYLKKEISYAEYLQQKQELEDRYTQDANKRTSIIEGN